MNYIIAVFIFLCLVSGCQPNKVSQPPQPQRTIKTPEIIVFDNGLECVRVKGGYHYGLSCNWEKFNKEQDEKNEQDENF